MNRSAEDKWKLVDKASYDEHRQVIAAIKHASKKIRQQYRFNDKYDLSDALISALYSYFRAKTRLPGTIQDAKILRERLPHLRKLLSHDDLKYTHAVALSFHGYRNSTETLSKALHGYKLHHRQRNQQKGKSRQGGRYPDSAVSILCRTLPIIYFRGTGKPPYSVRDKNGSFRGTYIWFANQCRELMRLDEIPLSRFHAENMHIKITYLQEAVKRK
jgi:hypothetical protein